MDFSSFKNLHRDNKIVVCGCGASAVELTSPADYITVGVNDISRLFTPNYLVVADNWYQFSKDRFQFIYGSRADYCFTQLHHVDLMYSKVIRIKLGAYGGTDFIENDSIHYTNTSAYMALCLAAYMGGNPIGLIGVDFTNHHFFGDTGPHLLSHRLQSVNREFDLLGAALRLRGVDVFNLSNVSRITAFRKLSIVEYAKL